jgi:hypothetical protein
LRGQRRNRSEAIEAPLLLTGFPFNLTPFNVGARHLVQAQ